MRRIYYSADEEKLLKSICNLCRVPKICSAAKIGHDGAGAKRCGTAALVQREKLWPECVKRPKEKLCSKMVYPLRIKIPVQIIATNRLFAVLAVYIYRLGDEQMKAVLPASTTTVEMPKAKEAAPCPDNRKKGKSQLRRPKKIKYQKENICWRQCVEDGDAANKW